MSARTQLGRVLTSLNLRARAALRPLLSNVIDWFIPEKVRSSDVDHLRRARLAVTFAGTLTLVAVPFCAFHILVHSTFCATAIGVGICVGLGCLYTMRRTGSWILTGNLSAATVFGVLTVLAAHLEGHGSLALPWYAAIPIVALMTAGRRSALCWVVVTCLSLGVFYGMERAGYAFSSDLSPGQYALLDLVSMTGLVLLLSSLAFLYETSKNQALSERRKAEEQLAREKGISDSLIASLPGMFYLFDEEGKFVRWNENLERVSGYSGEELSRMKATDFFADHDRELIAQRIKDVLKMGKSGTEADFRPKNGQVIPYLFSSRPVMIDGLPHLVGTGLDITARKRIEEALQASEERFRQFAVASGYGLVMTDLNGQLVFTNNATVQMLEEDSIETLKGKTYHDYHRAEEVERIEKEIVPTVLACGQWKGEILLVSANGKLVPTEQSVFLIRDNQGEPRMLGAIITDIKFTEVGKVQVVAHLLDAESEEPRLQIEVTDSGIGISKQHMSRLFQPFSQGDSSSTRKHGGTGLGLAISKRLAQKLGGDIRVKSNVGEGCTFTVTVTTGPLDRTELVVATADAFPAASPRSVPQAAASIGDCRVLLAEDGPDNQRLIAFLLRKTGAEVVVVDNGRSACNLALSAQDEGLPFDVILMDMQMPVMDGYDATSELRKKGYAGPIIALTAHAMSTDRDKCLQTGCDDYMTKPIDRERLTTLIGHYAARGRRKIETC